MRQLLADRLQAARSEAPSAQLRLRPLTERILVALPGRRHLWIAVWALVPWANAGLNLILGTDGTSAVWEQSDLLVILNYGALSFAVVMTLWGTRRIARRVETLRASTSTVLEGGARDSFREMKSAVGPLALALVTACAFGASAFVRDGWSSALLRGATWLVLGVALWTFVWTYASLQLGLNRLGEGHLRRDAALVDRSLGLRPLGAVAFMGLWMLLVWLVPVVLTGLPDVVGVVVGALVLCAALGTFFISLWRLHRQMVAVKEAEVAAARGLYAQAYEPVRTEGTLEALERQRSLLSAADALEQRARSIHEWPIDEGTWAWVITLATSVVAITVGRLVVNTLGL
jgi:hypothetical protein